MSHCRVHQHSYKLITMILIFWSVTLSIVMIPGAAEYQARDTYNREISHILETSTDDAYVANLAMLDAIMQSIGIDVSSPDTDEMTMTRQTSSPSGEIAYVHNGDIYILDVTTNATRQVTSDGDINDDLAWSPDGEWLAFSAGKDALDNGTIFTIRADGTDRSAPIANGNYPSWSPDGQQLVFSARGRDAPFTSFPYALFIIDRDGSNQHEIVDDEHEFAHLGIDPSWSRDHRIAFTVKNGPFHDLVVINSDGSEYTTIAKEGAAGSPAWSRDGTTLAFTFVTARSETKEIRTVDPDDPDASVRTLADLAWNSFGSLDWSPDGQWIVCSGVPSGAGSEGIASEELFIIPAQGGAPQPLGIDGSSPAWRPAVALEPTSTPVMATKTPESEEVVSEEPKTLCVQIDSVHIGPSFRDAFFECGSNRIFLPGSKKIVLDPDTPPLSGEEEFYRFSAPVLRSIAVQSNRGFISGELVDWSEVEPIGGCDVCGLSPPMITPPIVFVPGYWACAVGDVRQSSHWQWISGLKRPKHEALLTTGLWPPAAELYDRLLGSFLDHGYILNENLFVSCYDWSGEMAAASDGLAEVIEKAHNQNNGLPVTIITYSTGGLVARYYIQNNPSVSQDMIQDLFLIAPPNQGIARSYYTWEGGIINMSGLDPHDDGLAGRILEDMSRKTLYNKCKPRLLEKTDDTWVYNCLRRSLSSSSHTKDPDSAFAEAIAQGVQGETKLPILTWFLPNWNFLGKGVSPNSFMDPYPTYPLKRMNDPQQIANLFKGIQGTVHVLAGQIENSTIYGIRVLPPEPSDNPLWKNGKPIRGFREPYLRGDGDGTVLLQSSDLYAGDLSFIDDDCHQAPEGCYQYQVYSGLAHNDLVKDENVISYIVTKFGIQGRLASIDGRFSNYMCASIYSPGNLMVISPDGQRTGIGSDGNFINEIPDAVYGSTDDSLGPKHIFIFNPQPGDYQFNITGIAEGGEYMLSVTSPISNTPLLMEQGHIEPNETKIYQKTYVLPAELESVLPPSDSSEPLSADATQPATIFPLIIGIMSIMFGVLLLIGLAIFLGFRHSKHRS